MSSNRSCQILPLTREGGSAINVSDGLTDERVMDYLTTAIGTDEIPAEVIHVAHWRAEANVATRMQAGRVFLAGDAAHVVPPHGGFGGQTPGAGARHPAPELPPGG